MHCLKCGSESPQGQVFCQDCLQKMDTFPIDPATPVVIIPRDALRPDKEQRRKRKGYADTIRTYRKLIRNLIFALAVSLLLILVLTGSLLYAMHKLDNSNMIGKNYTTVETGNRS